jgi:preprotein translocase subunit Sec63
VTRLLALVLLVLAVVAIARALLLPPPRPGAAADGPWDPWGILGVPRGAAPDVLTRAYHDRLKEYHPDRVAGLGAELQDLAHRKTLDIQRAYAELTRGA